MKGPRCEKQGPFKNIGSRSICFNTNNDARLLWHEYETQIEAQRKQVRFGKEARRHVRSDLYNKSEQTI